MALSLSNDSFPKATKVLKTIALEENNRPHFLANKLFYSFMQHILKCCVFFRQRLFNYRVYV